MLASGRGQGRGQGGAHVERDRWNSESYVVPNMFVQFDIETVCAAKKIILKMGGFFLAPFLPSLLMASECCSIFCWLPWPK